MQQKKEFKELQNALACDVAHFLINVSPSSSSILSDVSVEQSGNNLICK
jgi:hypothetical protein